jgi:hypothetical protein
MIILKELWPHIAGKDLARKTQPLMIEKGTLSVSVVDERWEKQLKPSRRMLVDSVNAFWGKKLIDQIRLEVNPTRSGEGWIEGKDHSGRLKH